MWKMTKEMAIDILRGDVLGTNEQTHEAVFMAIKALKEQVEVVRCKDCKHHKGYNCDRLYGMQDGFTVMDDDYCSHPERKEEWTK